MSVSAGTNFGLIQRSMKINTGIKTSLRRHACTENFWIFVIVLSVLLFGPNIDAAFSLEPKKLDGNHDLVQSSDHQAVLPVTSAFMSQPTHLFPMPSTDPDRQILSQDDGFTTQAALSLTRATQTNNIVDSRSYYDIIFRTSTSGVIRSIEFAFPPDTYVGVALLMEVTGIGPGQISHTGNTETGQTITYTVANPVLIPALTNIRVQLANIDNPSNPSNSLTVEITTKNSVGTTIDGPTPTKTYSMKPIGNTGLADNSVTSPKIADGTISSNDLDPSLLISKRLLDNTNGASAGWNPNGIETDFIIFDDAIEGLNAVLINVGDSDSNSQCEALGSLTGFFTIRCNSAPPQGSELRYTITNIPIS